MFSQTLPLFLFALVATISPGGATALATISGLNFGFRSSLPLMLGISLGLGSMATLAGLGLAAILLELPVLQLAMKIIGAAYLLWLAWQTARRGRPDLDRNIVKPTTVIGGIGLLWVNPKAWAMTLGAAASFAGIAESSRQLALLMGMTFTLFSLVSLSLWCVCGIVLARLLKTDCQWRILNVVLGLLLAVSVMPILFE